MHDVVHCVSTGFTGPFSFTYPFSMHFTHLSSSRRHSERTFVVRSSE